MSFALWPLIVAIVGGLLYALAKGKTAEVGKMLLFIGLLWLVQSMAGKAVKIGRSDLPASISRLT